jgi:hypothetical protein
MRLQGKRWNLGTFPDAITAALCYDREATRVHGANARLNFPPGCSPGPTTTAAHSQSPMLPAVGGPGRTGPEPNTSLPVGNAEGSPVTNTGPVVSLFPVFKAETSSKILGLWKLHGFLSEARHERSSASCLWHSPTWGHYQEFGRFQMWYIRLATSVTAILYGCGLKPPLHSAA